MYIYNIYVKYIYREYIFLKMCVHIYMCIYVWASHICGSPFPWCSLHSPSTPQLLWASGMKECQWIDNSFCELQEWRNKNWVTVSWQYLHWAEYDGCCGFSSSVWSSLSIVFTNFLMVACLLLPCYFPFPRVLFLTLKVGFAPLTRWGFFFVKNALGFLMSSDTLL